MTMTDIETRLTDRLGQLASYAPEEPTVEFSAVQLARVHEIPNRRAPVWAVAAGVALVVSTGATATLMLLPDSHDAGKPGSVPSQPAPIVHPLTIEAHDFFYSDASHLQTKNFTVPAGITEITFVSTEGSHTLAFAEPDLSYVHLSAPEGRNVAKVELAEGRVYTIYDTNSGHRALGMAATITVGAPDAKYSVDQVATTTPAPHA